MNATTVKTPQKFRTVARLAVACWALAAGHTARAVTVATWTFETSLPATAGPFAPEVGAGAALGFHSGSTVYSNPVGNGSAESFSSTNWLVGDYYQFQVSTVGLNQVQLSWDQASSNTGPRDFQLQYSTNGTTFSNFGSTYQVLANASPNPVWTMGTYQSLYTFSVDMSSIVAVNNAPNVYFRLTMASTVSANGGTVAGTGTSRVDNFSVSAANVPEPATLALAGTALVGLIAARRLRRGR